MAPGAPRRRARTIVGGLGAPFTAFKFLTMAARRPSPAAPRARSAVEGGAARRELARVGVGHARGEVVGDGVVREEEGVLAEIPTAATRQEREEEAILAEIPTAATRQELWNVIRAARLDAEHNSCAEEYWKGEEDAM